MSQPLDELYLKWLYSQVDDTEEIRPNRTCYNLLRQFLKKEFVWFVPNDDNRLEDGRDLRGEFVDQMEIQNPDPTWMRLGCSMLELLIGLSRRLSFEAEREPKYWFWRLVENAGLYKIMDNELGLEETIDRALEMIIWRTYESDGTGGLFPLRWPKKDQRKVELWYQLSAYVLELD